MDKHLIWYLSIYPGPFSTYCQLLLGLLKKVSLSINSGSNIMLLHQRLQHPSFTYLKALYPYLFINKDIRSLRYEHYNCAKQSCKHYPIQSYKLLKPLHLIHSDIWVQHVLQTFRVPARLSMITLESVGSISWKTIRRLVLYSNSFINSLKMSSNHQSKIFRADNGREYMSNDLTQYICDYGIFYQTSCAHSLTKWYIWKNKSSPSWGGSVMLSSQVPNSF